ncbi:hypothetical protein VCSRO106_2243 [Vibrio cholerae]|nr:hypothetical protein VCSRO106_2243 [Vibrio cholerae]
MVSTVALSRPSFDTLPAPSSMVAFTTMSCPCLMSPSAMVYVTLLSMMVCSDSFSSTVVPLMSKCRVSLAGFVPAGSVMVTATPPFASSALMMLSSPDSINTLGAAFSDAVSRSTCASSWPSSDTLPAPSSMATFTTMSCPCLMSPSAMMYVTLLSVIVCSDSFSSTVVPLMSKCRVSLAGFVPAGSVMVTATPPFASSALIMLSSPESINTLGLPVAVTSTLPSSVAVPVLPAGSVTLAVT